jgi:hypothetical protein
MKAAGNRNSLNTLHQRGIFGEHLYQAEYSHSIVALISFGDPAVAMGSFCVDRR